MSLPPELEMDDERLTEAEAEDQEPPGNLELAARGRWPPGLGHEERGGSGRHKGRQCPDACGPPDAQRRAACRQFHDASAQMSSAQVPPSQLLSDHELADQELPLHELADQRIELHE